MLGWREPTMATVKEAAKKKLLKKIASKTEAPAQKK